MNDNFIENLSKSRFFLYYEKYMLAVGILGQLLFYVQGIKIFVTKSANDVSMLGFLLGLISVASWLVYGILIKNKILIIANAFAVIGAAFVITGVLIHGN
jgi:MtN3 and saliva related transmembrane protein